MVAAHVEALDVIGLAALRPLRLGLDSVGASEEIEVVNVITAQEGLQREEHVAQLDTQRFDFIAVDLEFDLGNAGIEAAVHEADLGTLTRFGQKSLQDLRELRGVRAAAVL